MTTQQAFRSGKPIIVSIDGRIRNADRAMISIHDWGVRYGWGAFETIRVSRSCPLFLSRHLERFAHCARVLLLDDAENRDWWHKEVRRVLDRADIPNEATLNLLWTRGEAPGFRCHRIIIISERQNTVLRQSRVWVAPWRIEPTAPGTGMKTLAYFPNMFATVAARAAGFDDALVLTTRGNVADGAAASVFAIDRGHLLTPRPADGALKGITQGVVLQCAKDLGIPAKAGRLTLDRLLHADNAFLTSALRGITVLSRIGDRPVRVTPRSRDLINRLKAAYRRAVAREIAIHRG